MTCRRHCGRQGQSFRRGVKVTDARSSTTLTPRRSVTLRTEIIRSYFGEDRHDSPPDVQGRFFSGRTSEEPLALCGAHRPQSEAGTGARAIRMRGQTVSDASWPNSAGRRAAQIDTVRSVKFLQTGHSLVVACNKATVPARTNRSGKWQHLRQSQVPQHVKYVLRGTLNVPRAMCNAESTPQRRAQRTHDNALVG